ncbi:MAG: ubiquinone biosynthesis regulatory protein kinase UbiB, partial [Methyloprofundus sp.]|nr:ubiquinone biosynthesis regulatory protein kinase UbiB [Methyloprofundus sp.]
SPKTKIKQAIQKFPELAEKFPEIPSLLYQVLDDAAHTSERAHIQSQQLEKMRKQMRSNHTGTIYALLASATVISMAILFQ